MTTYAFPETSPRPATFYIQSPVAFDGRAGEFYTTRQIILAQLTCLVGVLVTPPSVPWTVRFDADRTATGTEVVVGGSVANTFPPHHTTGQIITTLTNDTIPANNFVWLEIGSPVTASPTSISVTLHEA